MDRIYLDNNASTAIDPRILEVVVRILRDFPGNSSSVHAFGQELKQEFVAARQTVADFFGVKPQEIIFTSGATEGINMVIKGIFEKSPGGHMITSNLEHPAVFHCAQWAEKKGVSVTYLEGGTYGAVSPEAVKAAIKPSTKLIVLMAVNNETGIKTDIEGVAAVALEAGIPFLVDGVAWLGKELFTIPDGVTAICFSGHKIHAPKGVGVAVIRKKLALEPLLVGGQHEFGRRAGTPNVSSIIGLAKAIELLKVELPASGERMCALRDTLEKGLRAKIAEVQVNGTGPRICNTLNVAFPGIEGETLLAQLDLKGVAVSHGSACASGALEPSRILSNMGLTREVAGASIRISLSRMTTEAEVDRAVEIIAGVVNKMRAAIGTSRQ